MPLHMYTLLYIALIECSRCRVPVVVYGHTMPSHRHATLHTITEAQPVRSAHDGLTAYAYVYISCAYTSVCLYTVHGYCSVQYLPVILLVPLFWLMLPPPTLLSLLLYAVIHTHSYLQRVQHCLVGLELVLASAHIEGGQS
jgi:hypothetical protein